MEVRPDSLATERPITVVLAPGTTGEILVTPVDNKAAQTFAVPVRAIGSEAVGQFTLALPGHYRLEVPGDSREIFVPQQENLSFAAEFGLFSVVVILIVVRMALWMRNKPKNIKSADGRS